MEYQLQNLPKTTLFFGNSVMKKNKINNSAFPITMLPNEMQVEILSQLPTDDMMRCESVCKEWKTGIEAWASNPPMDYTPETKQPFYFIFNTEVPHVSTYAYITDKEKWILFQIPNSEEEIPLAPLELPLFSSNTFNISASGGLVCFMDAARQEECFVCNPIIKNKMRLVPKAPGGTAEFCATTLATNLIARKYDVAMVKSYRRGRINIKYQYDITIDIY